MLLRRLAADPRLRIQPDTQLTNVSGGQATLRDATGAESRIAVATVIMAQGRVADPSLANALAAAGLHVKVIGDALTAGRIGDAVRDAYKTVLSLARQPIKGDAVGELAC